MENQNNNFIVVIVLYSDEGFEIINKNYKETLLKKIIFFTLLNL